MAKERGLHGGPAPSPVPPLFSRARRRTNASWSNEAATIWSIWGTKRSGPAGRMSPRQPTRGPRQGVSRIAPLTGSVDGRGGAGEASLPPRAKRHGPPSFALIHPSAWKGNSAKSGCRITHKPGPDGSETPASSLLHRTGAMHLATRLDGYADCWMPRSNCHELLRGDTSRRRCAAASRAGCSAVRFPALCK